MYIVLVWISNTKATTHPIEMLAVVYIVAGLGLINDQ